MLSKKTKISFYINSLSMGGAEKVTIYLAEYMKRNDVDVEIITNYRDDKEYTLSSRIPRTVLMEDKSELQKLKIVTNLRKHLTITKPNLVIVMASSLTFYIVLAKIFLKTDAIISERNSPEMFAGKRITQKLTNTLLSFANGFVFQTKGAAEYYSWIKKAYTIIPNPLFLNHIPKIYYGKREKNIVTVGRLNTQKNQKLLIDAFSLIAKKHPKYNLIIYGEGPEREDLENQIKDLNLTERVFLPGSTPKVLDKIKKASIFAFSSDFEGMPNALIEAMALGLPVVSTDCPSGGPRELIENEVNGLLTPVRDKLRLADKLDYLLSNPNIANELGNEALKVREKLDADKIGRKWLDFSLKIINEKQ